MVIYLTTFLSCNSGKKELGISPEGHVFSQKVDTVSIYFKGCYKPILFKKTSNQRLEILPSKGIEPVVFLNFDVVKQDSTFYFNVEETNLKLLLTANQHEIAFEKVNSLSSWDSLTIEGFFNDRLVSTQRIYPNRNIDSEVFSKFILDGSSSPYKPKGSINKNYLIKRYSNKEVISDTLTTLPFFFSNVVFESNSN